MLLLLAIATWMTLNAGLVLAAAVLAKASSGHAEAASAAVAVPAHAGVPSS